MRFLKHPRLEAVIEVPDSSVPIYRQSDWVPLTDQEVLDLKKHRLEARAARTQPPVAAPSQSPAPKADAPTDAPKDDEPATPGPAPRKSGSKTKEIS